MSTPVDDSILVSACREGRTEAYGTLVRKYQDKLYPTVLRLTGRPEDARDLLQDTFLRAFEKLHKFQGESSFFTWIYRIAVNLALSKRRRRFPRLFAGGIETKNGTSASIAEGAVDPRNHDPSAPLETVERERIVQDALNRLANDHRVVIVLKEYDGLAYDEIAQILNVPVGTVRSRLHRARMELRERLRFLVDDEESPHSLVGPIEKPVCRH